MKYRLERARGARRTVLALLSVALLGGIGLARLVDDTPTTSATFDAAATSAPATPALVQVTAAAGAPAPPGPSTPTTTTPPLPPTTTPTTVTAPTTVASPFETLDTLPEQRSEPIAPPLDPRADEELIALGSISIPSLGVDEPLLEGIRLTTLDNGPGHWPGTALPGEVGNVVVAAHRTSHGGPFRHIDQLVAGDAVEFTTDAGASSYVVTGTQVVAPDAIWIVDPTDTPTATLFACHPPGSTSQRIVVNLELAS